MMNKMITMAMMMVLDAAAIGALNVGDRSLAGARTGGPARTEDRGLSHGFRRISPH